MRTSEVLWSATGRVTLSWEVIFDELLLNGSRPTHSAGPFSTVNTFNSPQVKKGTWNARGATVPVRREFLVVDGNVLASSLFDGGFFGPPVMAGIAVTATQCTGGPGANDPASPPVGLTEACTVVEMTSSLCGVAESGSMLPWTTFGCDLTLAQDTSLTLNVARRPGLEPLSGNETSIPMRLAPHIKVVGSQRKLVRALSFLEENCRMRGSDGGSEPCDAEHLDRIQQARACRGFGPALGLEDWCGSGLSRLPGSTSFVEYGSLESEWTFTAPTLADGRLQENFAPGVKINRILIFALDENGQRRNLTAAQVRRIRFDAVVGSGSRGVRCRLPEGSSGVAQFDLPRGDCEFQGDVTPAWGAGLIDSQTNTEAPLIWKVGLIAGASDGVVIGELIRGPGNTENIVSDGVLEKDVAARPGDQLFVEFDLTNQ